VSKIIVDSVSKIADASDMDLIAEGIEENFERFKLQSFGCEMGQGYLFSKPLGVEEATQFILKNYVPIAKA